jgi:hypothetical protein
MSTSDPTNNPSNPTAGKRPNLRVVGGTPPLNLGPLTEEHADILGRHQSVIDATVATGATTVSRDAAPEWSRGDDDSTTLLTMTGLDSAPVMVTLTGVDPTWHGGLLLIPSTAQFADDVSSPVILVEGTANALAVAAFAPADTVVAYVPSPRHLASAELRALGVDELVNGRQITLYTTTSPVTDRPAHDRAREVSTLLSTFDAASVNVVKTSEGTPLEFLTGPLSDPASVLRKLISDASPIAKIKAPAARRKAVAGMVTYTDGQASLGDYVSTLLGQIVSVSPEQFDEQNKSITPKGQMFAGWRDDKRLYAYRTLFEASVTVERTIMVLDDLAHGSIPMLRHVLDVQIGAGDEATHYAIDVADGELSNPSVWRTYIGAEGAAIIIGEGGMGDKGGQRIAEAIRGTITPSTPVDTRLMRTGWWSNNGVARWLDATGGHGPEDKTTSAAALVHNAAALIDIPPASQFKIWEIQASVRALFEVLDWVDDAAWMTGMAATFYALSGQHPVGALWWVGDKGAGKSFILGMLCSILGPSFGPKHGMYKPEATLAAMRSSLHECHNVPMWIDDNRQRATASKQQAQDDTMEMAIRASAGGAEIPPKAELDASKKWAPAPIRDSHPFICVGGEALPPERSESSIERLLAISIIGATSIKPGGARHLEEMHARHAFAPAAAAFLQYRARTITEKHGADLRAARVALSAHTDEKSEKWLSSNAMSGVSPRVKEVTATFLAGAAIFIDFAAECGAIDINDIDREYWRWAKVIIKSATNHYAANLASSGVGDQVLEAVKGQIASRRSCIGKPADKETPVGYIVKVGGVDHVALIPSEVRKVAQSLGISGSGLGRQMAPVLLVGPERTERKQRVDGSEPMWVYVVRLDKMDPAYYQTTETPGQWGKEQVNKVAIPDDESTPEPETAPDIETEFGDFVDEFVDTMPDLRGPNPKATITRWEG